jgi:hypothetical protein
MKFTRLFHPLRLMMAIALLLGITATSVSGQQAQADAVDGGAEEEYCVATLATSAETQREPVCFVDEAAADALVSQMTEAPVRGARSGGNNVLARHYKSTSFTGGTVAIVGTTCSGGVWYTTGSWNNNIESTLNYCNTGISHYDGSNCSGSTTTIFYSATTLSTMNNRTSCVRYGS